MMSLINLSQRSGLESSEFRILLQGSREGIIIGKVYPGSHVCTFNVKVKRELKEKLLRVRMKRVRDRRKGVEWRDGIWIGINLGGFKIK